ncbi:outer membrane usher protein [Cronobacter dublinensis subsp. dublinensis]|nr:outer membrane usher protein [Cronobacter dublinensis subsp. dublinensis]EGT5669560.1 outer membrane usher protein [Cronobacter dublinensis subsp. dublinensis]EGT5674575.1 outer membrane usher protein [Cronobacter dublinensis subsp. dublinensis]EGT5678156.1 outer membrane usher protein [Cronobacter dublinensis subsp. dublinensis]EGT5686551.1 outer membrane usher protein [Cronobacter dublinensis subsp. dublinensis]
MARQHNKQATLSTLMVPSALALCICACLRTPAMAADDIQFNTDVLDVKDKQNIDLSQFSKRGYIMPGYYTFTIKVNQNQLEEQPVSVLVDENDKSQSRVCFTPEQVKKFGLKEKYFTQLKTWHNGQCVDVTALNGVEATPDLGSGTLTLNVPQAYLEYTSDDWVPPAMWDNGIPGLIADYNVNAQTRHNEGRQGGDDKSVSGNGTVGANVGPWRLRADWQANYDDQSENASAQKKWTWSRFQMYRALPKMGAKLTVGEDYMNSDLFDSVRFAGASVVSDDNMLPPNLRGYAPEVTGVAKTNAKVTISQQGRVIYETQVAAGPFAIQDLNNSVSGALDVRVQEQDGSVQEYKVNTASIPYLTRPGSVRYKMYAGRPSTYDHHSEGHEFGSGEFSWGISNGWSLYGGLVASRNYLATALGVGRDLMALGALAFDITRSGAKLDDGEERHGQSYRVSYSKRFDETGSQVTFAGYRFSEKDFMSFNDYLNYKADNGDFMQSKEMYTVTFSQQFERIGLSAYLNYSHQTYWNNPAEDRYSLSLSRYFDIGKMKNISASLTAYRNKFNGENDDGMYMSLSVPMGDTGSLGLNSSYSGDATSHNLSYYNRLNNGDNYRIAAGGNDDGGSLSGYYDHPGDLAEVSGNVDYQHGQYSSAGVSLRGGMTATAKGAALHRANVMGGTRVLLDTGDAADIPVQGYANATTTNRFGKAVVTEVSDYSKNSLSIDINNLPENAEASASVVQATLTEGAIGYRKFNVISGIKAMAILRLADGTFPPFGASVRNAENQEVGIVNDEGQAWLSGLKPGHKLQVNWNGATQCAVTLPESLQGTSENGNLLLPCR